MAAFREEHDPHDLNLERDVWPIYERMLGEVPTLVATVLRMPYSEWRDAMYQVYEMTRSFAEAKREAVEGHWTTTCAPTLYKHSRIQLRVLGTLDGYVYRLGDTDAPGLRIVLSMFRSFIDELWNAADIAVCPDCEEPSWDCCCETCDRCGRSEDDCECERCDRCGTYREDCECSRCPGCGELL